MPVCVSLDWSHKYLKFNLVVILLELVNNLVTSFALATVFFFFFFLMFLLLGLAREMEDCAVRVCLKFACLKAIVKQCIIVNRG